MANAKNGSDSKSTKSISWKDIGSSLLSKVADINLNPASILKDKIDERKERPVPAGLQEAKQRLDEAKAELDRSKALTKVVGKAEWYKEELAAFAKQMEELGASQEMIDTLNQCGDMIVSCVTAEV